MVLGSDSTHMVVTSPVISKQRGRFFWENLGPGFSVPSCHPSTSNDLSTTALDEKRFVRTLCTVSGSDSTHIDVTDPMTFEKM